MWLVKGYDDIWVGYPRMPGGPPRPAPPADTEVIVFFTCHHTHQFIRFTESTIAGWDAVEQMEAFACTHCGETHLTAHGCAYLWVDLHE